MSAADAHEGSIYDQLQPIHSPPTSFIKKYWFSTDHKVIARQFIWSGMIFLAIGGFLAMLIRWQWAFPGQPVPLIGDLILPHSEGVIGPSTYNGIFTSHGLIMIFFAITPLMIGAFGNLCLPLQIGARDMAFPLLNMLSFHTFFIALLFVLASFFQPMGTSAAGWTTYPPLSTQIGTPGMGQTYMICAIWFTGTATIMGSINYVTTVMRLRAPGMTWTRMPLTVWGLWLTAILNVLFVPVLAAAAVLLIMDRHFGTQFFIAGANGVGDPILFQHLFWIFGHPEVYILILPAWGFVGDLLSYFSRKPAYWYKGQVYAMITITVLSAVVYGHHMFVTGMNPLLGQTFMLLTLVISVPAELLFLNWLHTIWKGSIRFTSPMIFALGMVFVFGLGGLTGIFLGTVSTDLYLHDTMFVVGHFHFTMAAAAFLGTMGAIYFWFPKLFGTQLNETWGRIHAVLSTFFITWLFGGQLVTGFAGQQRRLWDPFQYTFLEHLAGWNAWTSYGAFLLGLSQIIFVVLFFHGVFKKNKNCPDNPWDVGTLEWEVSSPPPVHNFDTIPTVLRGPHEFAHPDAQRLLGRDWLSQTEVLPDAPVSGDTGDAAAPGDEAQESAGG